MYLAVVHVEPSLHFHLILTFENGEKRLFNMSPYLNLGIFKELNDIAKFNAVKVSFDSIEWENGADMDPEILYTESTALETQMASEPKAEYGNKKQLPK